MINIMEKTLLETNKMYCDIDKNKTILENYKKLSDMKYKNRSKIGSFVTVKRLFSEI